MKLDILVFGAHPDDAELGAGATIAKEVARGRKVGITDLTRGELGTRGTAEIRDVEAREAARILGVAVRTNLGFRDGFFSNDQEHQMEVIRSIRSLRPDIVICNAIYDRHIDHGRGSSLVADSCFLSGLAKIVTQDDHGRDQAVWRPRAVYHYIQWKNIPPDIVVDVSGFIPKKIEALGAYRSQFYDPNSKEPETPISSRNFFDSVLYRARDLGRLIGVEQGEGFTVDRLPGIDSLDQLI